METSNSVSATTNQVYYLVYKTTNIVNKLIYVGQHVQINDFKFDGYLGSGVLILSAISEFGKENFIRESIEFCSSLSQLGNKETYWIEELSATDRRIGYNLMKGTIGINIMSKETRKKMGDSKKGKHPSEKTRKKMSKAQKGNKKGVGNKSFLGKHHTDETRKKMSKASKGKPKSEEARKNMSNAQKGNKKTLGYKHTDETRKKMSKASKGKPKSKEHIRNMSTARKGLKYVKRIK